MQRLLEIKAPNGVIPFQIIIEKICRGFSMNKQECWETLFLFRDLGFIEFVGNKGIKIIKGRAKELIGKEKDRKLSYKDIPLTCINQCDICKKEFEAKITIEGTCKHCNNELNKRIDEIIKKEGAESWQSKLLIMVDEYGGKKRI